MDNWVDDFRYLVRTTKRGVLTDTFHPQVTGRRHRIPSLDRLMQALSMLGARVSGPDAGAWEFAAASGRS